MRIKQSILISLGMALILMAGGAAVAVEAPAEEWTMTFGGTSSDVVYSVQQTSDGGYILAGYTNFYMSEMDAWLIKTNDTGIEEWSTIFDSGGFDVANSVQQTFNATGDPDGFILTGCFDSDAWLVKINDAGMEEWSTIFDSGFYDAAYSVQQTFNATTGETDGYILVGLFNGDARLIKTNDVGMEEWSRTFGGWATDSANFVQQTTDGGYILTGYTDSYASSRAAWLIKTNDTGIEEWSTIFDSGAFDVANSVQQTFNATTGESDGYILAGSIGTFGTDAWLIKTDLYGNQEWSRTFGNASYSDMGYSVQQTIEGGYILAGCTYVVGNYEDAWLIKTNDTGIEEWNMTFGGSYLDYGHSVQQTIEGGYILAGSIGTDPISSDAWLIKVAGTVQVNDPFIAIEDLQNEISVKLENPGIIISLNSILDAVVKQLEKGDKDKAIKKLDDFIGVVEKMEKKGLIDSDIAGELITEAGYIQTLIG